MMISLYMVNYSKYINVNILIFIILQFSLASFSTVLTVPKPASDPVLDYFLSEDYEDDTTSTTLTTDLVRLEDLNISADMEESGDMIQDSFCLTLIIVSGLLLILGLLFTVCYCRHLRKKRGADQNVKTLHYYAN